jgi:pimeloyl-ACP methyl ester carboxylesterase
VVVFENGWSSSWQQWTLVEPLLAPHTQLLFYDRAGVGASAPGRSHDGASLSADLAELLVSLNVKQPVVVVGQSYGGLMAGLHAAQLPAQVGGIVQLDPTPEIDDTLIDQQLGFFRKIGVASIGLARLRLRNPLFKALWTHFPEREARLLEQRSYLSPDSLRGALVELDLLGSIRAAITAGLEARRQPRLVISAGSTAAPTGRIARALLPQRRLQQTLERMQSLHRAQAARGKGGIWELAKAHDHGGLVSTPAGAEFSAGRILAFLQDLGSKA